MIIQDSTIDPALLTEVQSGIADCLSAGEPILAPLVQNLAERLDVKYAFVGQLSEAVEPASLSH